MLKLIVVGLLGISASLGGSWLNQYFKMQDQLKAMGGTDQVALTQIKTEMTGVPVVTDGDVSGYLVFQLSSTVDVSKFMSKEFDVAPYLLDAAIRASYRSTEDGTLEFTAAYFDKFAELVKVDANKKLAVAAVVDVNVQQFNFVPKSDVRGNVLAGNQKQ